LTFDQMSTRSRAIMSRGVPVQLPGTAVIAGRIGRLGRPVSVRRGSDASAAAKRYLYIAFDNTGAWE
jgi:hypothetical protein